MRRLRIAVLLLGLAVPASADPSAEGSAGVPAVVDVLLGGERRTLEKQALIAMAELAPDQPLRVVEIGRDAHSSLHVVGIARGGGEPLHRHDRHELVVVMLRGHGSMRLGEETRPAGEGSVFYVPRGAVHAFRNGSDGPAHAFVLYSPPFDGEDRVLIEP